MAVVLRSIKVIGEPNVIRNVVFEALNLLIHEVTTGPCRVKARELLYVPLIGTLYTQNFVHTMFPVITNSS
jgi:hypothetical protein